MLTAPRSTRAAADGGLADYGFAYLKSLGEDGDDAESSYPCKGRSERCRAENGVASHIEVTGFADAAQSEAALKNAVGTVGPVY